MIPIQKSAFKCKIDHFSSTAPEPLSGRLPIPQRQKNMRMLGDINPRLAIFIIIRTHCMFFGEPCTVPLDIGRNDHALCCPKKRTQFFSLCKIGKTVLIPFLFTGQYDIYVDPHRQSDLGAQHVRTLCKGVEHDHGSILPSRLSHAHRPDLCERRRHFAFKFLPVSSVDVPVSGNPDDYGNFPFAIHLSLPYMYFLSPLLLPAFTV